MNALETGLFSALAGGTALTTLLGGTAIYNTLAPQGSEPPYVVFNQQAESPVWTLDGVAYEDFLYQVQAVTVGGSMKEAGQSEAAVDDVLSDGTVTVVGYGTMYVRRQEGVSYAETVDGRRFNHRGAIYRLMVAPS